MPRPPKAIRRKATNLTLDAKLVQTSKAFVAFSHDHESLSNLVEHLLRDFMDEVRRERSAGAEIDPKVAAKIQESDADVPQRIAHKGRRASFPR